MGLESDDEQEGEEKAVLLEEGLINPSVYSPEQAFFDSDQPHFK